MTRPGKPAGLITRAETKVDKAARLAKERALSPRSGLPMDAPSFFERPVKAAEVWRWLMRTYAELDGQIITKLDQHLLTDYCRLMEQLSELDQERASIVVDLQAAREKHDSTAVASLRELLVKYDSRIDRKRALLLQWRQSLYLTPRARAGVAPAQKEVAPEHDPFEEIFDKDGK